MAEKIPMYPFASNKNYMRGWGGGGEGKNDHAGRPSVTEHNQSTSFTRAKHRP